MTFADVQLIDRIRFQKHLPQSRCMIEIFRGGEGVVDGEGIAVKDA